ncbi:MAG: NUDIX hydrolase, partial [Pseudonocardiaceae bacterium]
TEVAWVSLADLPARLAYADERRLVQRATTMLADSA